MYLFTKLTALLPKSLQGIAKAVYPALATLVAVGVQYASSGTIAEAELATAVTGLLAALITFSIPNRRNTVE